MDSLYFTLSLRMTQGMGGTGGMGGAVGYDAGGNGSLHMARGPVECTLLVLVARAENLPTIRG